VSGLRKRAGIEAGDPARGLAVIRLAALPVVLIGQRLVEHPRLAGNPFD
jgi:hypothetical protein